MKRINLFCSLITVLVILLGCSASLEKALEKAKAENSPESIKSFLDKFPNSLYNAEMEERYEYLVAIELNTKGILSSFSTVYPVSPYKSDVEYRLRKLEENKAFIITSSDTLPLNSNDPDDYYRRGVEYYKSNKSFLALNDLQKSLELNSNYKKEATLLCGNILFNSESYYSAFQYSNKAIELDPDNPETYILRGFIYYTLNQADNAIIDFKKALKLDSHSGPAYEGLGFAYEKLKEFDQAIYNYQKALQVGQDDFLTRESSKIRAAIDRVQIRIKANNLLEEVKKEEEKRDNRIEQQNCRND